MNYPDLDVMILTYNRSKFLKTALEAVCESNAVWRKTVVLNNASTDNTLEVVAEVQKEYPNRKIEVITNPENLGNVGNFKRSQEVAENKYIAIFHDDDAVHPEYIDRAMQLMEANSKIVMSSGGGQALYNVDNHNWDILPDSYFYYPSDRNAFLQLIAGRPNFCCTIYKTRVYKTVQYHPEKYGKLHDISFLLDVGKYGDTIFLPGSCIRWRQHAGSDSNTLKNGPFPKEVLKVIEHIRNIYLEECPVKSLKEQVRHLLFQTLLFNFAFFLFRWSDGERFMKWEEFKEKMLERRLFTGFEFWLFDHMIDAVLNPCIRKLANHCRQKYSFSSTYRAGELP